MAVLTLPLLCYNVFAVLWSTLSLLFSGPVYMEIQSFGDSLCYHPGHQALPIRENPLCYDDQCEAILHGFMDDELGMWQNESDCVSCSSSSVVKISSSDSKQSGQVQKDDVICAMNITVYTAIDDGTKMIRADKKQNPFAVLTITTFLSIARHPLPDLSVVDLNYITLKILDIPLLEKFEFHEMSDLIMSGNEIAVHLPQVSLELANFPSSFMSVRENDNIHLTHTPNESKTDHDTTCTESVLMNISDVLVKKKNSKSVIKMSDPLFKEKIVMPAATVGMSWIVGLYVLLLATANGISCLMNKRMGIQVSKEIATNEALQKELDQVNMDMRLQTRRIAETMEKYQEEKKPVRKRRRVVILKACKDDCATWQLNAHKRATLAKSKVLKREIISLKRKMKNATQLRNLVQSRKCAMSAENRKLEKLTAPLKDKLQKALSVNEKIKEQSGKGRQIIKECLQAKENEEKERLKLVQEKLEMALKDVRDKSIMLKDDKQEIEEKLKAANLKLSSIQEALEHKEKQLQLNIRVARSAIDEYKDKLDKAVKPASSKPPEVNPPTNTYGYSMVSSLRRRFSSFVSSGSENSSDSVESSATANPSHGIIEQDPFDCEEIGLSNSAGGHDDGWLANTPTFTFNTSHIISSPSVSSEKKNI